MKKIDASKTLLSVILCGVDSVQCLPTLDFRKITMWGLDSERFSIPFKKSVTLRSVSLRGVTYFANNSTKRIFKKKYVNLFIRGPYGFD